MIDPIILVRKNILELSPYSTARDEYDGPLGIYLDANESPYNNDYNRYPDPHQRILKERLSQIKGAPAENIFIGNGSDEPIDLAFRVFCEPGKDNAVSIAPTYGMYKVAAAINNIEMREVRLREDFSLDVPALLAATDEHTKLLFICSPNNPTGNSFPAAEIEQIIQAFNGIVVLDEAYIDFSEHPGFLSRLADFPNLIILQTLSKAWGMAGLRIGLAFARKDIIAILSQVKYPYNINIVAQRIALEQLEKKRQEQIAEIRNQRKWTEKELAGIPLVKHIYPSDANFLLVRVEDPHRIYHKLIGERIIVRDRSKVPGCKDCLRITIGTQEENKRMIEAFNT
ncbi:histidinol-phosphate aminotransferase [Bacteroidia bacterium]|nr:histidinol-phosphate aminotransferase [Bacteroidia bacterium]GHT50894.1 histidinol-phosphate aminotransferase [Bacteroidia bacterium]